MKTKSKDASHPMGYSCRLVDLLQLLKENMKLHEKLYHDVQKKSSRDDVPKTEKNHPKGGIAKGQPSPTIFIRNKKNVISAKVKTISLHNART
jgi:hypothetical protein